MIGEPPTETDGRTRLPAVLAVVTMLLAIVVVALLVRPHPEPATDPQPGGPSALLDQALASGTPAYVLIHSLT